MNPFADLKWDRGGGNTRPDFTDTEIARIFRLARESQDTVIKWGNLLAAYGGDEQNEELADLHARDIECIRGVWVAHISLGRRAGGWQMCQLLRRPPLGVLVVDRPPATGAGNVMLRGLF